MIEERDQRQIDRQVGDADDASEQPEVRQVEFTRQVRYGLHFPPSCSFQVLLRTIDNFQGEEAEM